MNVMMDTVVTVKSALILMNVKVAIIFVTSMRIVLISLEPMGRDSKLFLMIHDSTNRITFLNSIKVVFVKLDIKAMEMFVWM